MNIGHIGVMHACVQIILANHIHSHGMNWFLNKWLHVVHQSLFLQQQNDYPFEFVTCQT